MNPNQILLRQAAGPLYLVILLASLVVLLRGHNEPGGGFIAGLVATTATVLLAAARGVATAERRLPAGSPVRLGCVGVLIATLAGVPAWGLGDPFLTHLWGSLPLGWTELKVSTVLIFDLGVYLCVWGALAGYALALLGVDEARQASAEGAAIASEERP
jgi:multicomponent Na+:H+ antiporter subunit B